MAVVHKVYVVAFASEMKKNVYGTTYFLCEKCESYYEESENKLVERQEIVSVNCQRCGSIWLPEVEISLNISR